MSYILDALRRSEEERNQEQLPSFRQETGLLYRSRNKTNWVIVLLSLALLVNAIGLVFIYLKSDDSPQRSSTQSAPAEHVSAEKLDQLNAVPERDAVSVATLAKVTGPNSDSSYTSDARTSSKPEPTRSIDTALIEKVAPTKLATTPLLPKIDVEVAQPDIIRPKKQRTQTPATKKLVAQSTAQVTRGSVTIASEPIDRQAIMQGSPYEDVEYLYNMNVSSRPKVKPLRFNSHIYSDDPSARRVMINNIYLREGQELAGIQVLEIGELDIVFEKAGTQFKLPAMRDWNG
jgi:general secretion pathway protein B